MRGIKVGTVEEAVREAKRLKDSGRPYWFRGQSKGWPLRSSLCRADRDLAMEKFARFHSWIKKTPRLENLAANTDKGFAVAQHYGLPTNFVDFTTQPEIAGFFASEYAGPATAKDLACIICLDVQDFKEFWQRIAKNRSLFPEFPEILPELLEMTVPDLWRLEAQHGCFLFCPYENMEQHYNFDRILFPNTHTLPGLSREKVYPERKSHLEILLDQYFMNERMIENERAAGKWEGTRIVIESPKGGCDPQVFPKGLPEHTSWAEDALKRWLYPGTESFNEARKAEDFRVIVPDPVRGPSHTTDVVTEISQQLLNDLFSCHGIRSKLVRWHVETKRNCSLPHDFESRLSTALARLWDGLRRLPHSDKDISLGFGLCVACATVAFVDLEFRNDGRHWERVARHCLVEPVPLDFGSDDGSYSRSYASAAGLAAAIRPDMLSYVAAQWRDQIAGNVEQILHTSWNPKKTFDFGLLTSLFAREIAPYQVLTRDHAIFYTPARLVAFGLP